MSAPLSPHACARLSPVRLFAMDVDGVLTDGRIVLGTTDELKFFHVRDGQGLKELADRGIEIAWITARRCEAVARRAAELGCVTLIQGCDDKLTALQNMVENRGIRLDAVAYMGDDLNDLPVMRACGFPCAPGDAVQAVRAAALYVTRACGGHGAVREVCDLLMQMLDSRPARPQSSR